MFVITLALWNLRVMEQRAVQANRAELLHRIPAWCVHMCSRIDALMHDVPEPACDLLQIGHGPFACDAFRATIEAFCAA